MLTQRNTWRRVVDVARVLPQSRALSIHSDTEAAMVTIDLALIPAFAA